MEKGIKKGYVIGVDGGGTKTEAALANLDGKILKIGKAGSSHPRNLGLKKAIENLITAIKKVLPKEGKILSTFIGLPAVAEEYKFKKSEIKKELRKHKKISEIFKGRVIIDSDQKVAFKAGIDGNGIMLNTGTGCVAYGLKDKKEVHVSGWGWLADEGGAFFVGQKVFQVILKDVDGRGKKTTLKEMVFRKFNLKGSEDFLSFVYQINPTEIIPKLSIICDGAAKKGDKIAKKIIIEAANEAALTSKTVIKKLNFKKVEFILILTGGMLKSKIFTKIVKKEIKKFASKVKFIFLKRKPVIGAVKLAIEQL